jgi:hypothetical protein
VSDSIIASEPIWSDWDSTGGSVLLYAPGDVIPADVAAALGVTPAGTRVRKAYVAPSPEAVPADDPAPAPAKATRKGRTARSKATETREGTPE